jgi:hypothetical protein
MKNQAKKKLIPAAILSEVDVASRDNDTGLTPERIVERYKKSLEQRQVWESHWRIPFSVFLRASLLDLQAALRVFSMMPRISAAAVGIWVPGP